MASTKCRAASTTKSGRGDFPRREAAAECAPMEKLSRKWPFKPSMIADAPDTSGVYALWRGDTLIYVGRAEGGEDTLHARLAEHLARAASCSAPMFSGLSGVSVGTPCVASETRAPVL